MKKNHLYSCVLALLVVSCGTFYKVMGGLTPVKVYTNAEVLSNISGAPSNEFVLDYVPIAPDADAIQNQVFEALGQESYVYSPEGLILCYNGDSSCSAVKLQEIAETGLLNSYKDCGGSAPIPSRKYIYVDSLLKHYRPLSKKHQKADSVYTIVTFWNTDIEKKQMEENWNNLYNSFNTDKMPRFIRIWTDLNADWGLKAGAKVGFKVRMIKGEEKGASIELKELPYTD